MVLKQCWNQCDTHAEPYVITVHHELECIWQQKSSKAIGLHDTGNGMEMRNNGCFKLALQLCVLFSLFLKFHNLPPVSCSVLLFLSWSSKEAIWNNYRAAAISISKECIPVLIARNVNFAHGRPLQYSAHSDVFSGLAARVRYFLVRLVFLLIFPFQASDRNFRRSRPPTAPSKLCPSPSPNCRCCWLLNMMMSAQLLLRQDTHVLSHRKQ